MREKRYLGIGDAAGGERGELTETATARVIQWFTASARNLLAVDSAQMLRKQSMCQRKRHDG